MHGAAPAWLSRWTKAPALQTRPWTMSTVLWQTSSHAWLHAQSRCHQPLFLRNEASVAAFPLSRRRGDPHGKVQRTVRRHAQRHLLRREGHSQSAAEDGQKSDLQEAG